MTKMKHLATLIGLSVALVALLANSSIAQDFFNRIEYSKPIVGIQATPYELIISSQFGIEVIPFQKNSRRNGDLLRP